MRMYEVYIFQPPDSGRVQTSHFIGRFRCEREAMAFCERQNSDFFKRCRVMIRRIEIDEYEHEAA